MINLKLKLLKIFGLMYSFKCRDDSKNKLKGVS